MIRTYSYHRALIASWELLAEHCLDNGLGRLARGYLRKRDRAVAAAIGFASRRESEK